jgi:hypothetical protein
MKRKLIEEAQSAKDILSLKPIKRLRTSQRQHEFFFEEIPTEVIYKIVEYCGIIEKHVLRFVCKRFHFISHKCNSIQEGNSFFVDSFNNASIITFAAKQGYLNILEWIDQYLPTNFDLSDEHPCELAAREGHLEVLKWLKEKGYIWNLWVSFYAASHGHLEILKWSRENGCPWNSWTCSGAAEGGHLEVLRWARENGCTWNEFVCSGAASNGHLEILKWARKNKCPWTSETCSNAASAGHLEVLKWTIENGCPCDENTCSEAAKNGYLEVLKWARENGWRACA